MREVTVNDDYKENDEILKRFAEKLNIAVFLKLLEDFLEDPVILYKEDNNIDITTALQSDFYQRLTDGEFVDVEQYLSELCVRTKDDTLRDILIDEFELDREYIETELLYNT